MDSRLIILRTYSNYSDGLIDKAKLEDTGITCFLKQDSTGLPGSFFSNTIGGITLMVNSEDAETADAILNDQSESTLQTEEENENGLDESPQMEKTKSGCFSMLAVAIIVSAIFLF